MKKILFFTLIYTSLFSERYEIFLEYQFIQGCAENGNEKNVQQCICMLSEIEKVTSQAEMIEFSIKAASGQIASDQLNTKIMEAAMKCTSTNK